MHECLNQLIAWCKNKKKKKKEISKPNPQWITTIKSRKLAEKTDFFFFFFNLLYDNWHFIALYILLCYLLFKILQKKYSCLTQGG